MTVTLSSTAVTKGTWVGTSANPVTLTNQQLRLADDALFASAGIASGLVVSVDGADLVTVTRGSAVIDGDEAVTGTGVYRAGIPASVTGTLEARHATNARIDLVVFRQYDQSVVGSHPAVGGSAIEIIPGTPSATPVVPSKPSMAVELGRINVPASGGGAASVNSANRVTATTIGNTQTPAAAGVASLSTPTTNLASTTVTFPVGRFSTAPVVVVTPQDSRIANWYASSVTTTQFTLSARTSVAGITTNYNWVARESG